MRLVVAGLLVASVFVVAAPPSASACTIDLGEPTDPRWSENCDDPDHLITVGGIEADASTDVAMDRLESHSPACDHAASLCDQALDAHITVDPDDTQTLDLNVYTDNSDLVAQESFQFQVHQPSVS